MKGGKTNMGTIIVKKVHEAIEDDGDEEQDDRDEPEEAEERHSSRREAQAEPKQKPLTAEEIDYLIDGTLNRLAQLINIRRRM